MHELHAHRSSFMSARAESKPRIEIYRYIAACRSVFYPLRYNYEPTDVERFIILFPFVLPFDGVDKLRRCGNTAEIGIIKLFKLVYPVENELFLDLGGKVAAYRAGVRRLE